VLNKLGIIPLAVFMVSYPITNEIDYLVRLLGLLPPPRLERLVPWLNDSALGLVPRLLRALRLRRLLAAPRPAQILLVVGAAQPASQPSGRSRCGATIATTSSTTC